MSDSDSDTQSLRTERLTTIGLIVVIATVLVLPIGLLSFGEIYQYSVGPAEIESSYVIRRQEGKAIGLFNRVLVFSDEAKYEVASRGYASESITFSRQSEQRAFSVELEPLPGYLNVIVTGEFPVSIHIDGKLQTQSENIELARGRHVVAVMRDDVRLDARTVEIEGFGISQDSFFELANYQAILRVNTKPRTATIELDGERLGHGTFEGGIPAISGQVRIAAAGYDAKTTDVSLEPGETLDLKTIELIPSPITAKLESKPSGASILLDGSFVGESPSSFPLRPGQSYELTVRKPGFREHKAVLTPEIGKNINRTIDFERKTIQVDVQATPSATVFVNGIEKGVAPLTLDVYPGDVIEARNEGLTSQSKTVSEDHGTNQSIAFELLEPLTHAYHFAPERVTVTGGLELIRFPPVRFQKSVSIDDNETMSIEITRPFYLGATEVTIGAYRLFQSSVQGTDKHPISDISWLDAVKFCNWLSAQWGLQPFYQVTTSDVVDGIDVTSLGFRLPSEAEWETGAGFDWRKHLVVSPSASDPTRIPIAAFDWRKDLVLDPFEWGTSGTIPLAYANLAGRETSKSRTRYFESYIDNHEVDAPVASYLPNANGLYDLTGNVSEWTHNYYQIRLETNGGPDYLGPRTGFANVVKGSNYETYELDEVATSYREFETGKRKTLGFRVARWIF